MATVTVQQTQALSTSVLTRQRLPASAIRIIDPARETPIALAFAVFYIAAAFGVAALLWFAAVRRYHQEKLAVAG